ncbi:MAG: SsrA-binding protein [Pseudomonadota bacterium]|jgi:SsrA-binding protein
MTEAVKLIASHPSARADYFILETLEAGIMLTGTEVKSIRNQSPTLKDAYIDIFPTHGSGALEAWLLQMHIAPYSHGNIYNHEPLRKRKLLLSRRDIDRLFGAITQEGLTLVPLRLYFKQGRAKVELGLAKGKKRHDKREDQKERSAKREMDVAMKRQRSRKGH